MFVPAALARHLALGRGMASPFSRTESCLLQVAGVRAVTMNCFALLGIVWACALQVLLMLQDKSLQRSGAWGVVEAVADSMHVRLQGCDLQCLYGGIYRV